MNILLLGAHGQLGQSIQNEEKAPDFFVYAPTHEECDITNYKSLNDYISAQEKIDLIINAAAHTDVTGAEKDTQESNQVNIEGVGNIVRQCKTRDIPLIHISTDYIFDGKKPYGQFYTEQDKPNPINEYGLSKLSGEEIITSGLEQYIIIRTSWLFSPYRQNFYKTVLHLSREKQELEIIADQFGTPTSSKDLARAILKISEQINADASAKWGIYNYAGQPAVSWYDFALKIVDTAKKLELCPPSVKLKKVNSANFPSIVKRPANSALKTGKIIEAFGVSTCDWEAEIERIMEKK